MRVAAVLLAAGASRRFGDRDKLLVEISDTPLVRHVGSALAASRVSDVVAVVQPGHAPLLATLKGLPVRIAENPRHEAGLGTSIAAGISALSPDCDGALVVPGDLPGLTAGLFDQLIAAFEAADAARIVYPVTSRGAQRNPVLWPRRLFHRLAALDGEAGGKSLLTELASEATPVRVADDWQLEDIDTPADLATFLARR